MAYDVETLLAAFQASILYLLVQEKDPYSGVCHRDEVTFSMAVKSAVSFPSSTSL